MLLSRVSVDIVPVILLSSALARAHNSPESLPIVDLGYELYRATEFNQSRGYYNFSNIRYAAPPVGDLRFRAPEPPVADRAVIKDGSIGRICPQASTGWGMVSAGFLPEYLVTGRPPNISFSVTGPSSFNSSVNFTRDLRETEDCLFLDVFVPQKIFDSAGEGCGAPVLVWIYGGGFAGGDKASSSPTGLIDRSITNDSDGIIYVAMNYRVGAFGFLSGPSFQEEGTANAGLHDQRFALQWVQDNIHLFGGDKNRVTVFGESAGGGSIIHQITAYGGKCPAPFQQAIPQSPGWFPYPSLHDQEQVFQDFLMAADVSNLEGARSLPSDQLISANARQVAASIYGQFKYGPAVDGDFVTQDPKSLLDHGQFDQSVKIMAGHNTNEGLIFTPPITNDTQFDSYVRSSFPGASSEVIDYITGTLYPPVYNGTGALYRTPIERATLVISEAAFTCNNVALHRAYRNDTYAYLFGLFPGLHGQDVAYTYYDPEVGRGGGNDSSNPYASLPFNETVALVLQDYITSFATRGVPESTAEEELPAFGKYGGDAKVIEFGEGGIVEVTDSAANERCRWWSLGLIS